MQSGVSGTLLCSFALELGDTLSNEEQHRAEVPHQIYQCGTRGALARTAMEPEQMGPSWGTDMYRAFPMRSSV